MNAVEFIAINTDAQDLEFNNSEDLCNTSQRLISSLFDTVIILSTDVWPIPLLG